MYSPSSESHNADTVRWIFIIEGIVTVVAGFIAPFFLVECKSFPF